MKGKTVSLLALSMLWFVAAVQGVQKTSDEFPYKYEADVLPSADSPAYTYNSTTQAEAFQASVSGGILTLDTGTDGQDSDNGWYVLTGGTGTVWDPITYAGPWTIEVRMRSFPNNAGAYNAYFEWLDGNSSILLQVWHNKVSLNGVEITGLDNQTTFHSFRIVSDAYLALKQV